MPVIQLPHLPVPEPEENLEIALIAARWLGEEEIPPNRGFKNPEFQRWLESFGWRTGAAWCGFFVRACYLESLKNCVPWRDSASLTLLGSVVHNWQAVTDRTYRGYFQAYGKPSVGDVACWQKVGTRQGHCGIVEKVDGPQIFTTIEGNTNDTGSREGLKVCRHPHTLAEVNRLTGLKLLGFIGIHDTPF